MVMIGPIGTAHKGWVGTQHEWRNWFWKNKKVKFKDSSTAFHNNEVGIAVHEWSLGKEPDAYGDKISKLLPILNKYINVLGDCAEK